jgi:uncharacterized lipoprotein YajG
MPGSDMRMTILIGLWVGLLSLCGCAWVHQTATLTVQPQISPSRVGSGSTVTVRVIDKRPSRIIGYRGMDSKNAEITTDQDVAGLFQQAITIGLTNKGFTVLPYGESAGRLLTVEIDEIAYTTDMEMWKGSVQAKTVLHAVSRRDGTFFRDRYVGQHRESTFEAPGAKTNERIINTAIAQAVQRMFEDERLLQFLVN